MLSLNFTALTHPLCTMAGTAQGILVHHQLRTGAQATYFVHLVSTQQAGTITGAINLSPQGNHARSNISLIAQAVSQHTLRGPQRTHPASCFIDYIFQANVHAPMRRPPCRPLQQLCAPVSAVAAVRTSALQRCSVEPAGGLEDLVPRMALGAAAAKARGAARLRAALGRPLAGRQAHLAAVVL